MDKKSWDSLSKTERGELLKKAGLPTGLSQLSWSGLQKSERTKLEKATKSKGKGWHEQQEEVRTGKGIEKKAPIHREVAIKKEASEANNTPMQKPAYKEGNEEAIFKKAEEELELIEGKLKLRKGNFKGKTASRCPECFRGLVHFACGQHGRIKPEDALDLRNIGTDEKTTKVAKEVYQDFLDQAKESEYKSIQEFYDLIPDTPEQQTLKEYWLLAIGLEKIFGGKKEPRDYLPTNPPQYDPKFEQSEDERMKDEGRREEGTYEDIVVPFDTGDIGEMRGEAGIDETYRKLPEDWFTANRQKEWETHEVEGYEGKLVKSYEYYVKKYPLAMEWVNKHHTKITNEKELADALQFLVDNDRKAFEEFLQEKQDEIATKEHEKQIKAQERKTASESKYFMTKFRDIDDHNKKECVERTPVQKAHPFGHKGIALFAYKDGKQWKVTEATTGLELARAHQFKGMWRNNTKEEIIRTAKAFVDEKTPEKVSELIKYAADTISRTSPCQS